MYVPEAFWLVKGLRSYPNHFLGKPGPRIVPRNTVRISIRGGFGIVNTSSAADGGIGLQDLAGIFVSPN